MTVATKEIFIVEDHPAMRQSLIALVQNEVDFAICGEAGSAEEAINGLNGKEPDLVLVDISLPGQDGIALIRKLRETHPDVPTLAVSGHESAIYGPPVMEAGASGYVMKRHIQQLLTAMRRVLAGETYLSEDQ